MPENLNARQTGLPKVLRKHLSAASYGEFLEEAAGSPLPWLSLSLPVTGLDPLACLEIMEETGSYRWYLENPDRESALAGAGSLLELKAEGENRFGRIREQMRGLRSRFSLYNPSGHTRGGPQLTGGFSFFGDAGSGDWEGYPPALFTLPRWSVLREGRFTLLTLNLESWDDPGKIDREIREKLEALSPIFKLNPEQVLRRPGSGEHAPAPEFTEDAPERERWNRSVERAVELIGAGRFDKIVLARKVTSRLRPESQPTCLLDILRRQYPSCYSFLVQPPGRKAFLGCTPERLASFHRKYLLTEALAGSIRRGSTASEDAMFGRELMVSSKNRREHNLVIKDIEHRLRSHVTAIECDARPRVKKLSNVQHLYTPITAWLRESADPLALVDALHPTAAVGGYPREAAAPWIRELESFDRGWYAGPLGWLDLQGGGEFVVGIRSALMDDREISFFAGCGIMGTSNPDTEWDESNLKLRPMLAALSHE